MLTGSGFLKYKRIRLSKRKDRGKFERIGVKKRIKVKL